jgi:hypothetical protein
MEESPKKTQDREARISQDVPTTQQPGIGHVYERLRQMRGKERFSCSWVELKEDR